MTSQAYTVSVTDVTTGTVRSYSKPASSGTLLCGGADTLTWAVKTYSSPGSYCGLSDTTAF